MTHQSLENQHLNKWGSTWVKMKCDMATLKVVESDVTLDKNSRKNSIKM